MKYLNRSAVSQDEASAIPLSEARVGLDSQLERGQRCPCCQQFAKVYKRKLNSAMAASLICFIKTTGDSREYHHMQEVMATWPMSLARAAGAFGGDFAKLIYWKLVEEKPRTEGDDSNGRTSGYWRITDKGRQFAKGTVAVESHVLLYDGQLIGFTPDSITIQEALGSRFNYEELMREEIKSVA